MRMAAKLAFLALSVGWANLNAADSAAELATRLPAPLTRPDRSGHPLPEGEGGNPPPQFSWPPLNEGDGGKTEIPPRPVVDDTWQATFNDRLDESLARLQTDNAKRRSGAVAVTWGEHSVELGQAPFATTSVGPEKEIARVLQEHGLPPGLTSVVAVESAFNPQALSPKGARGLWQLMPATARRYGLKVEPHTDDRIDPLKSTHAAAAYMKDLFAQFQDWPLALAAYNAGEVRVARAMTRTGARDFWTLRRRGALPEETLQYVPAVLDKIGGALDAPETGPSISPAAPGQNESPAGRIAYATPTAE